MAESTLLILVSFIVIWLVYKHYNPKIEMVGLVKHYRVYLWYNKYDGLVYKRVYKFLFEI